MNVLTEEQMLEIANPSPASVSLKAQLREALNELNSVKRDVGDDFAMFDYVKDSIKQIEPYKRVAIPRVYPDDTEHQAVFILADAHSEDFVDGAEMEGSAHYDSNVFAERMNTAADKLIQITGMMRHSVPVTKAHIFYLGDWFLGQIHPTEHGFGTSMPLPTALPFAAARAAEQVLRIASSFDKVEVWGMAGNHGRDTARPVSKMTADRNWDMSLYLIAQEMTKQAKNVSWHIPRSMMDVADVMGWKCLLTHGNCVKRSHSEPLFAISRMIDKQHRQRRKEADFDYSFVGHWHDDSMLHGECVLCPPLIGPSQFSRYLMHESTAAGALVYFFTKKHGRTCSWRLNL